MRASRDLNAGAASTDVQCESRIGVPWGKENGSLFCSSFMCRVVHLSRGHRVSPLTVGRLCVLECEYVWYGWYMFGPKKLNTQHGWAAISGLISHSQTASDGNI